MVSWHDVSIPIKTIESTVIESNIIESTVIKSFHINVPKGVNEMMDHISGEKIFKAKYEKANLAQELKLNSPKLKPKKRDELFCLLKNMNHYSMAH